MSIPYEVTGRASQRARTRAALVAAARELLAEVSSWDGAHDGKADGTSLGLDRVHPAPAGYYGVLRPPLAILATAAVAVLGCGGDDEEQRVREVALAYYDAIAARDYPRACSLMEAGMREQLRDPEPQPARHASCAEGVRRLLGPRAGAAAREAEEHRDRIREARVVIHGRFATLARTEGAKLLPGTLSLVDVGGEWRLHSPGPG